VFTNAFAGIREVDAPGFIAASSSSRSPRLLSVAGFIPSEKVEIPERAINHISALRVGKMAGCSLSGLEYSSGVCQEFSFVHFIAPLPNVLEIMRHFQDAPRERIYVFEVFIDSHFSLNIASSEDLGR
jgi:hypothetical protein